MSQINIMCNTSWHTANTTPSWIHPDKSSGNGDDVINLDFDQNFGDARSHTMMFETDDGIASDTCEISQDAIAVWISPNAHSSVSSGDIFTISVHSTGDWTLIKPSWCNVSATSGDEGVTEITVTVTENIGVERTGDISITSGNVVAQCIVTQEGISDPYVFTVNGEEEITVPAGSSEYEVGTYPVVSTKDGALQEYQFLGNDSEDWLHYTNTFTSITLIVAANDTGSSRTGTLMFIQDDSGKLIIIHVAQEAASGVNVSVTNNNSEDLQVMFLPPNIDPDWDTMNTTPIISGGLSSFNTDGQGNALANQSDYKLWWKYPSNVGGGQDYKTVNAHDGDSYIIADRELGIRNMTGQNIAMLILPAGVTPDWAMTHYSMPAGSSVRLTTDAVNDPFINGDPYEIWWHYASATTTDYSDYIQFEDGNTYDINP